MYVHMYMRRERVIVCWRIAILISILQQCGGQMIDLVDLITNLKKGSCTTIPFMMQLYSLRGDEKIHLAQHPREKNTGNIDISNRK